MALKLKSRLFHKKVILFFLVFFIFCHPLSSRPIWKKPKKNCCFSCGKKGGSLYLPATSDPKSFNPILAKETSTTAITSFIFEGLTRTDPLTLKVKPNLAKSWEIGEDKRTFVFFLREDVYWSDGVKFNADDVVFTFQDIIYNPKIPTSSRDIFLIKGKKIKVEKIDAYTVKFVLPSPFSPFLRAMSQEILPRHKYYTAVKKGTFNSSLGLDSAYKDIVGTGPFKLAQYLPGQRVVLKRNPYYWKKDPCGGKLPYLDKVNFIIIPNQDTELLKFLNKEIDYYSLRAQDLALLGPLQKKDNFTIYNAGETFSLSFLVFNQNPLCSKKTKKPYVLPYKLRWFADKRFRRAISYAINRKKIIDIVFNGLAKPQYSPLSPANRLYYTSEISEYPYNPKKAVSLLKAMGFKRNSRGYFSDAQNHLLEINFFTNADNTQRVAIASLVKKDLEDIGIKVNFLPLDFNNLVTKLTATFDWEVILIGLTGGIEPYFGKSVWSYKGQLHMWNPSKKPVSDYEETIEDIFNQAAETLSEGKRRQLFGQWQKIVSREVPLVYLVTPLSIYAVRNRFENLCPSLYGGAFSYIERIYIKEKETR